MANEKSPDCGKVHDEPFSKEVLTLGRKILEMSPSEERQTLLMELADLFAADSDWANLQLPEELHSLMEEYLQAKAQVAASSFRLGRYLLRGIGAWDSRHKARSPHVESTPGDQSATKGDVKLN
jgi:hypothetical protein